jgi:hypothetical protein
MAELAITHAREASPIEAITRWASYEDAYSIVLQTLDEMMMTDG